MAHRPPRTAFEDDAGWQRAHGRGRDVRARVPRRMHGVWDTRGVGDRDPVDILDKQAATRVRELVPIRYGRMLRSAFAFYRGAAAVMADDLASAPSTGLTVQLCGDAHLANFGGFAAPDRDIVFDINDFDETLPGPFEWDVKRLVASFAVAARDRGFPPSAEADLARSASRSYRTSIAEFARTPRLDVWYARLDADELERRWGGAAGADTLKRFHKSLRKARRKTGARAFSRYTEVGPDGRLQPLSDPPLVVPLEDLLTEQSLDEARETIGAAYDRYLDTLSDDRRYLLSGYRVAGMARKVVGVGSVGTRCWILLLVGAEDAADDLVLQVKEAGASVLEPYLGASRYDDHGRRVVEGQRLIQAASDVLLGWNRATNVAGETHDFYVRQMWDGKVSADLEGMDRDAFEVYAEICGWTLARAHARSGDAPAVAGYLGTGDRFDRSMAEFATAYADQNEADFRLLQRAETTGRIVAADG
ncbi:DUF2252 domain-containing protein [Isoptericola haloaureus]|uniref:DUF2252 domain-containing protein n=1 Tax=Isoptericola haloaureus TaxID=1542902 RepID=A0ABU7Z9X1_9MICO